LTEHRGPHEEAAPPQQGAPVAGVDADHDGRLDGDLAPDPSADPGIDLEILDDELADDMAIATQARWRLVLRRFVRHRLAMASLVVLVGLMAFSLIGGRLWIYTFSERVGSPRQPPSWWGWPPSFDFSHPMGTDNIGRDYLARVLQGAQKSVQVVLIVAVVSTAIGVTLGALAGYFRGRIDSLIARAIDLVLAIPLLAILAVLSQNITDAGSASAVGLIIGVLLWTTLARVVRAEFLSLREKEFVEAARAAGASDLRTIFRHVLPNAAGSIIVTATLTMATAILLETTLTFLGLGIRAPDTSLGLLISEGQTASRTAPWMFWFPGLWIIMIALSINFIGDGLRDALDPRQRRVRQ
jgi:ABC-type dipeptide/oligopeptide/nickel transport system permease subunit